MLLKIWFLSEPLVRFWFLYLISFYSISSKLVKIELKPTDCYPFYQQQNESYFFFSFFPSLFFFPFLFLRSIIYQTKPSLSLSNYSFSCRNKKELIMNRTERKKKTLYQHVEWARAYYVSWAQIIKALYLKNL